MIDCDKVIKGLECCIAQHEPKCDLCPYDNIDLRCMTNLYNDVKKLLELQTSEKPEKGSSGVSWWYACSKCRYPIDYNDHFCRHCGKAVNWK